jgi:peptidoglycan/LPS O-acetylase OafA/YrhL
MSTSVSSAQEAPSSAEGGLQRREDVESDSAGAGGVLRRGRIPSLDGLRAVSIGLVLLAHGSATLLASRAGSPEMFGEYGQLGVSVFFAISGFLITSLLLAEFQERQKISLKGFYTRRVFRIMPAFYGYIAVVGLLTLSGAIATTGSDYLSASLFVWNYNFSADNWFLGHIWSLSVEEQFYLFWPLMLVLLKPRKAMGLAAGLIVLAPALRLGTYVLLPQSRGHIPIMLHTRVDALMFGCLAALLFDKAWFQRLLQRLYRWRLPAVAACFLLLVSPYLRHRFEGAYLLTVGYTIEGAAIILVLLWAIQNAHRPVGRLLNLRPVAFIGVMSYSLYLWQQLFLTNQNTTFTGRFPLNLLFVFLAAGISYYLIERPCLRLRRRFLKPAHRMAVEDVPAAGELAPAAM